MNYEALKSRVCGSSASLPSEKTISFVELVPEALASSARPCVVEFEDGGGARMRIQLEQADATLLAALTNAFVRGAR